MEQDLDQQYGLEIENKMLLSAYSQYLSRRDITTDTYHENHQRAAAYLDPESSEDLPPTGWTECMDLISQRVNEE